MLDLEIFGFRAMWSPYFFLFLLLLTLTYVAAVTKYRFKFKNSEPATKGQLILFSLTILIVYIVKGAPLDLMGHLMFYAHMVQMAVLYLVVPPLLIISIPRWVWKEVLKFGFVQKPFRLFTKPLVALILFNGVFSFYHIPDVFDYVKQDMFLHALYTFVLFLLAMNMWWPLMNKLETHQSLNGLKKVGYVFANGVLLTPACGLIIFADTPMYATYSDPAAWGEALKLCVPPSTLAGLNLSGPEMFNNMSLVEDQRLGGVMMKIIQEVVYGVILAQIFFEWYRKEQEETKIEMENYKVNSRLVE